MKRSDSAYTFYCVGRTLLTTFARTAVFMGVPILVFLYVAEMTTIGSDTDSEERRHGRSEGQVPDMYTVIPQQIQLINKQGREIIRFTNGIANLGYGPWRVRPEFPATDPSQPQKAIQEILDSEDSSGNVVYEKVVSEFDFHPEHNHWHIDDVALYEVRKSEGSKVKSHIGSADIGDVYVREDDGTATSTKVTFCLIDWIKFEGNSNTTDRVYWDCVGDYQGISVGWVDAYHMELEGQDIDITGAPAGRYYLVSTANPDCIFIENDCKNNGAWVAFELRRDSRGNPKIAILDNSASKGEGVLPNYTTNR